MWQYRSVSFWKYITNLTKKTVATAKYGAIICELKYDEEWYQGKNEQPHRHTP